MNDLCPVCHSPKENKIHTTCDECWKETCQIIAPDPAPTVTETKESMSQFFMWVPRDEWERMQAESEAWKMVRHASEHCSSNVIIYEVRDQITRLKSLSQPNAAEGK